jgi:hypothetical protein
VADTGRATGKIWSGREVERDMRILVAAFVASPGDTLDPEEDEPDAIRAAKASGAFELDGLDTARSYRLIAIADRDGDGRPGSREETWSLSPTMVAFDSSAAFAVPEFLLGTLDSLGTIEGEVFADSGLVPSVFAVPESASVAERVDEASRAYEEVRRGTTFSLAVPTGATYRVAAFVDLDRDSLPDEGEPFLEAESILRLQLTSEARGLKLDLRGPPPESSDASAFDGAVPTGDAAATPPDTTAAPGDTTSAPR